MTSIRKITAILVKEWVLTSSIAALLISSIFSQKVPTPTNVELQTLFILFSLFIAVKGLENSGLILNISQRIEQGPVIPLKLVTATFILAMIITNDVALLVTVPLTLALKTDKKAALVILEALAANAGSALTPLGNPQNLFIYWYYQTPPIDFILTIAPLVLIFFILLALISCLVKVQSNLEFNFKPATIEKKAYIYIALLLLTVVTIFHLIPLKYALAVFIFSLFFDRKSLLIDYKLLLIFICLFGVSDNLAPLLSTKLNGDHDIFIYSALSSQFISNVPTALLFAKFTHEWPALLWGTTVGGFGNLIGSLANLIAYQLYINHTGIIRKDGFLIKFLLAGYGAFFIGIALYYYLPHS